MNKAACLLVLVALLANFCHGLDVCEKQKDGSRLAHPVDCGKYIVCYKGRTAMISSCPLGLHFNRYYNECDFKATAGCDPSARFELNEDTCAANCPCDCNASPPPSSSTTNAPVAVGCVSDVTACSEENDGAMIAVENQCNQYYLCSHGCANLFSCPNNLIFNMNSKQCDYPQNYDCPWEYTPTGPSAGPSGIACESHGRCLGQRDGTTFANDDDCSTYVVCQCECEVGRSCPDDLFFDDVREVCDWPRNVPECDAALGRR